MMFEEKLKIETSQISFINIFVYRYKVHVKRLVKSTY